MNVKATTTGGQTLTSVELAKQSRFALRTASSNLGARLPDPPIVGLLARRLVPKTILDSGTLQVQFLTNTIQDPQDGDEWELWQRKGTTGTETMVDNDTLGNVAGRPAEVLIDIPTAALLDDDMVRSSTAWQFQLRQFKGTDGNEDKSNWLIAEVDRNPPEVDKVSGTKFQPERAIYQNLPSKTIDEDWLANNLTLKLQVSRIYEFYSDDDTIDVYYGENYGTGGTLLLSQALIADIVDIPSSELPKVDGFNYLWYTLKDLTGNVSEPSIANDFTVSRIPPPTLHDCEFPQGISPDPIDLNDLQGTVYLNVRGPDNARNTDRISPTVSNGSLSIGLGTLPLNNANLLQFQISLSRLLALWNNATAPVPITGRYNFLRGIEPAVPSVDVNSVLNLLYPGPVNPGFPDIKNPKMVKVEVRGASDKLNHITSSDRLADVTISTPMKEVADPWVPVTGDVARLWINGAEVFDLDLTPTTTLLTHTMTPAEFDAVIGAPGKKYAYWTIENPALSSAVMESSETEVQVDLATVDLPEPRVRLFNGFVSCRYLTRPDFELPVTVDIDTTLMPEGTIVTVYSQGYEDALGTKPVKDTDFKDTYTVTGSENPSEFVLNVKPYLTRLKPIQPPNGSGLPNGYIKVWYSILIAGHPNPSEEFFNEVSLLNGDFKYCDEVNP
ncbi:UNVERIFIED_ORG: hypothetical protein J2X80_000949 [Pseudomonas fluorescens]|nr:hypothetical protein [Pseudomonas fluorescens]